MKTLELATDVIAGSTTFAGLSIIYVGAVAASYGSYPAEDQGPLRARFRRRAAMGAIGVGIAASAATLAILGKWAAIQGVVGASVVLLIITLAWGVGVTIQAVREIR